MNIITENCKKHGDYEAKTIEGFNGKPIVTSRCPACDSEREELERKQNAQIEESNRLYELDIARKRFENSVPQRFKNATLENFVCNNSGQAKVNDLVTTYLKNFDTSVSQSGGGLVLCGKVGTGKTHIAIGLGRKLAEKGKQVRYCTLSELIRRVRVTWKNDEDEQEVVDKIQNIDCLIIDEIGVQTGSENERNILFEIIDGRYRNVLPTIIISNLDRKEIANLISERSIDRITQGGAVIPFNWESVRNSL